MAKKVPMISSVLELEEALLSADGDELEELATETTRARMEQGPRWLGEALALFYAMTSTLLLMLPVSWVYKAIHADSDYDHSIDTTALVLPAVVAGIVTVVQHSLALAFSLAGIVAGVHFRRALQDTFDALFILAGAQGQYAEDLGFSPGKKGTAVGTRQDAGFTTNWPNFVELSTIDSAAFFQNEIPADFLL